MDFFHLPCYRIGVHEGDFDTALEVEAQKGRNMKKPGTKALPLLIHLLQYGRKNSEVVILEGILDARVYRELFETAKKEFSSNIYAYYYDLPFEETLLRHQTKPNCHEFGEEDMRRWWNEKDFIGNIPEKALTKMTGRYAGIRYRSFCGYLLELHVG